MGRYTAHGTGRAVGKHNWLELWREPDTSDYRTAALLRGADFRSPPAYATGIQVHEIGSDVIAYATTCKFACCLAKGTRVNAGTRRDAARSVERSHPNRTAATVVAKRTLTDIALT